MYRIGVDLGGTNIVSAVIDESNKMKWQQKWWTVQPAGEAKNINNLATKKGEKMPQKGSHGGESMLLLQSGNKCYEGTA